MKVENETNIDKKKSINNQLDKQTGNTHDREAKGGGKVGGPGL